MIVLVVIFLYIIVQTVMLVLALFLTNFEHVFRTQLACIALVLVAAYISIIGYLYIYYSGTPYKNKTYATMMKRLLINFTVWSVCQLPRPILTLANVDAFIQDGTDFSADDFTEAIVIFILQIVTEVFPFIISLEGNFLQIFTTDFKVEEFEQSGHLMDTDLHQVIQT